MRRINHRNGASVEAPASTRPTARSRWLRLAGLGLALVIGLTGLLTGPAWAAGPALSDAADLLSSTERAELSQRIESLRQTWDFDIVIHTVASLDGVEVAEANDLFYQSQGFGPNGVALLVARDDRWWDIGVHGAGHQVFNSWGREWIGQRIVPPMSAGDYAEAFRVFLDQVDDFLTQYQTGQPYSADHQPNGAARPSNDTDRPPTERDPRTTVGVALVIALVIALIVTLRWKAALNTARPRHDAGDYTVPGSFQLAISQDQFLRSHTSRSRRPQNDSSSRSSSGSRSSGGGSSFRSSSSHTSGRF
ncbi:MAG: TPM domain-containing protein [Propionibacteriaceae bacterium]|jgi:uncharacterized protein|nr:TPM domain-containing protein [Propionibacteriaceae bacterium]